MSNTPKKRPSGARKNTPSTEKARHAANDAEAFSIRVDGEIFTLNPADVTGLHEMRIRAGSGYSVTNLIQAFGTAPGADLVGIFMWAARMVRGEEADLEQILSEITYDSELEFIEGVEGLEAAKEEGAVPEA